MVTNLTTLTHKIAIYLHLVAERWWWWWWWYGNESNGHYHQKDRICHRRFDIPTCDMQV